MTTASAASGGRRRPTFTVVDRMKKARDEAGLDQQEIADKIAVARQTIGNYETGATPPRIIVLRAWAAVCDVDEDWLIGDYEPPRRNARAVRTGYWQRRIRRLQIVPNWGGPAAPMPGPREAERRAA